MNSISYIFKLNPKKMLILFAFLLTLIALALAIYIIYYISNDYAYQANIEIQKTFCQIVNAD